MDVASLVGLVAGFTVIIWSIMMSGSIATFIDIPSVLITIGGTITSTLLSCPMSVIIQAFKSAKRVFFQKSMKSEEIIERIIQLANVARREGLLALEDEANGIEDEFLKKGILLVVDGTDPKLVRDIMETELTFIEERRKAESGVFKTMATFAPAFGMIGTLIGLINMLKNLNDPSKVGPGMAVALITTFYGSILAYVLFIPIEKKMDSRSKEESLIREVMIEGILSIQAGENPRIIEQKLRAFFDRPKRRQADEQLEGELDAQKSQV
ncbi:chemotaxis protein MotA [Caldanaerobius fijiensis DSM 17918]|uniref:Chemotaxis protein MotA n=1 Tax=Caldanaerobius fijiensis DSM 17918 TaxID=1121256 RepID=A0A1M4XMM4_9THEO|nr:flagellar motor protein [Caldanaerobius fijiensis]SHE94671.1 chemotaxis protein MotA [Caldanaerobius fijiensis DSM 17918]